MRDRSPRPQVWTWYVVYCLIMALIYLLVVLMSLAFFFLDPALLEVDPLEAKVTGAIFFIVGTPLTIIFAIAPFLPKQPWAWVYHLVLICLGLTGICCLPVTIPLLIFWLRPETKRFFGKN